MLWIDTSDASYGAACEIAAYGGSFVKSNARQRFICYKVITKYVKKKRPDTAGIMAALQAIVRERIRFRAIVAAAYGKRSRLCGRHVTLLILVARPKC